MQAFELLTGCLSSYLEGFDKARGHRRVTVGTECPEALLTGR
jgi:hypothetical protein